MRQKCFAIVYNYWYYGGIDSSFSLSAKFSIYQVFSFFIFRISSFFFFFCFLSLVFFSDFIPETLSGRMSVQ